MSTIFTYSKRYYSKHIIMVVSCLFRFSLISYIFLDLVGKAVFLIVYMSKGSECLIQYCGITFNLH